MAYNPNEQFASTAGIGSGLRAFPHQVQAKTFAAGTGTLAKLTPVAFNDVTAKWQVWTGEANEIARLTADTTPASDGTFTLTVNGVVTGAIDHDATVAAIKQAIVAAGLANPTEVTVTETDGGLDAADGYVDIEFTGDMGNKALTITADFTLTGNDHVLTEQQAGVNGGDVDGLVWPDAVVLDSDEEVIGQVMLRGEVHYDDIVLPAGETASVLKAALREGPRLRGLLIQGLDQVR